MDAAISGTPERPQAPLSSPLTKSLLGDYPTTKSGPSQFWPQHVVGGRPTQDFVNGLLKGPRTWAPVGTPRAPCSPPHTGVIGATTCVLGVLRTRTAGRGATVRTGNPAARRSHLTALPLSQSHLRRTRRGSPSPQSDCNRRGQQHARGRETPLHPYHERHRCRAARAPVS